MDDFWMIVGWIARYLVIGAAIIGILDWDRKLEEVEDAIDFVIIFWPIVAAGVVVATVYKSARKTAKEIADYCENRNKK